MGRSIILTFEKKKSFNRSFYNILKPFTKKSEKLEGKTSDFYFFLDSNRIFIIIQVTINTVSYKKCLRIMNLIDFELYLGLMRWD